MKKQRGHFNFDFLLWVALAVGVALACGGGWVIWFAVRGLLR